MGDQMHGQDKIAETVRTMEEVLKERLTSYFKEASDKLGFPVPFFIISDKDQSRHR